MTTTCNRQIPKVSGSERIHTPCRFRDNIDSIAAKAEELPIGELLDLLVRLGETVQEVSAQVERHYEKLHDAQVEAMNLLGTLYHEDETRDDKHLQEA